MSRYWFIAFGDYDICGLETPYAMTREQAIDYMIDRYGLEPTDAWPCQKWQMYATAVDIF